MSVLSLRLWNKCGICSYGLRALWRKQSGSLISHRSIVIRERGWTWERDRAVYTRRLPRQLSIKMASRESPVEESEAPGPLASWWSSLAASTMTQRRTAAGRKRAATRTPGSRRAATAAPPTATCPRLWAARPRRRTRTGPRRNARRMAVREALWAQRK